MGRFRIQTHLLRLTRWQRPALLVRLVNAQALVGDKDAFGAGAVPAAPDHHDCWGDSFVDHQKLLSYQVGGLRLLGIDTTALDASGGTIDQVLLPTDGLITLG